MDILERLHKNIEAAQNGPYVGVKEQRDSWQEAAEEIERLRKVIDSDIDVAENYFEGIEDIKQDLEDFADNPPVGDLEHDRVRIAGMADQCADILSLLEKTMHHRKTTSEFLISFMEIMNDHGIDPSSTDIMNAWRRAENKKVTALEEEIERLRKQVEAVKKLSVCAIKWKYDEFTRETIEELIDAISEIELLNVKRNSKNDT